MLCVFISSLINFICILIYQIYCLLLVITEFLLEFYFGGNIDKFSKTIGTENRKILLSAFISIFVAVTFYFYGLKRERSKSNKHFLDNITNLKKQNNDYHVKIIDYEMTLSMIQDDREKWGKMMTSLENEKKIMQAQLDYYVEFEDEILKSNDNFKSPKDLRSSSISVSDRNRAPSTAPILEEDNPALYHDRRRLICTEILDTERTYVKILRNLVNDIQNPLEQTKILPSPLVYKMFRGLPEILAVNESFLHKLEKVIGNWSPESIIGSLFKDLSSELEPYTLYSYANTAQIFEDCIKQVPQLVQFLKEKNFMDINSLLITPIQRITRYILLLETLVKNTSETHPDYNNLVDGLTSIKLSVQNINERIKKIEREEALIAIQKTVVGVEDSVLNDKDRIFLYKGPLFEVEKGTLKLRYCFLFNDIFMIAKEITDPKKKKKKIFSLF